VANKQPRWWLRRLEELDASIASLSEYDGEDTDISIFDDDHRLLYGSGSIRIKGINFAVFSVYLASNFKDHLCVHALAGDARPVTKDMLQRIEETIDLTVADARRMLAMQKTPQWREMIRKQRAEVRNQEACRQVDVVWIVRKNSSATWLIARNLCILRSLCQGAKTDVQIATATKSLPTRYFGQSRTLIGLRLRKGDFRTESL